MPKKPSTTKQIATILDTENKVEQLERITQLVQAAQMPSAAVTVLYSRGIAKVTVISTQQITPEDVKFILNKGVDDVTSQIVRNELEQAQMDAMEGPPDMPEVPQTE